MAKSDINYPSVLPPGLQSGRSYKRTSPNKRTKMGTGREIQRRKWPNAPWFGSITWLMRSGQAQAFMAWTRDVLNDCNYWFNIPILTPTGYSSHSVRIVDHYDGPSIAGPGLWSISAEIEFDEGPLPPEGWGEFPDFIVNSEIIDYAINDKWPLNKWQKHADLLDASINERIPKVE